MQVCMLPLPEAAVLVRKLSQLTPLSLAIAHDNRWRPNQTLVSYTLAGLA
jgi:hypothetical protein